ncbi:hypothetical protein [Streptomyces wuyuanensis]|uniref:hypothetical protein n=1 Tax=Streptomyces wuyuanensis TaxID=1196353 RepID=UPI003D74FFAA
MTARHPERIPAHHTPRPATECRGWIAEHSCREAGADLVGAIIRAAPRAMAICTPPDPPRS